MDFIQKISDTAFFLKIHVKPNSKTQKVTCLSNDDPFLTILLQTKAIQNKANKELLNLIKSKLNLDINQIKLISGAKGRDKIIRIDFYEKMTKLKILNLLKI